MPSHDVKLTSIMAGTFPLTTVLEKGGASSNQRRFHMKPTRAWIVIADGANARVFESHGPAQRLAPVESMTMSGDHRANHEILADRPSRKHESVGPARHAIEPLSHAHRDLKRSFAQHVVDTLDAHIATKSFDRFVLVAPPKTLGDLRSALTPALRSALHAEGRQGSGEDPADRDRGAPEGCCWHLIRTYPYHRGTVEKTNDHAAHSHRAGP